MAEKAPFTWNPDGNDVYDGDEGSSLPLSGPFSVFNKIAGKNFTMNCNGATLALHAQGGGATVWGQPGDGGTGVTTFTINNGATLIFQPEIGSATSSGKLIFAENNKFGNALLNFDLIGGNLIIEGVDVESNAGGTFGAAATTINASSGSSFRVNAKTFTAGFNLIAHGDPLSVSVMTNYFSPSSGMWEVDSDFVRSGENNPSIEGASENLSVDVEKLSVDVIVTPAADVNPSGIMSLTNHDMYFDGTANRFKAVSMFYDSCKIEVTNDSSMLIACDAIAFGGGTTVFSVDGASSTITFTGQNGGPAPFDFFNKPYPKGLFNFEATQGKGKFRFANIGSAFDFNKLASDGTITVNGNPDPSQTYITWTRENDTSDPSLSYFTILLK